MLLSLRFAAHSGVNRFVRTSLLTGVVVILLAGESAIAFAQETTSFEEQHKLIKAPNAVVSIGADLFGDKINLYNGSLEFTQTDVSVPGNNRLPVAVGRRLVAGRYLFNDRPFSRWDLDIPHMHGVFAKGGRTPEGWKSSDGSNSRCSGFGAPPEIRGLNDYGVWTPSEFWQGNHIYVPGNGDQQLLWRDPGNAPAPGAFLIDGVRVSTFPVVTSNKWAVGCLPTLANDTSANKTMGQGFVAVSPDGTKYKFDWMVTYKAKTLTKSTIAPLANATKGETAVPNDFPANRDTGEPPTPTMITRSTLATTEVWILPTKVIDRFGNTVTYTYDAARPANLTRIESSDGRVITISYWSDANGQTNRIQAVNVIPRQANDRSQTWTYTYDADGFNDLSQVQLPDASLWQLNAIKPLLEDVKYQNVGGDYCTEHATPFMTSLSGSMTHPSGATGTFTLIPTEHGRSDVQYNCMDRRFVVPVYFFTNSLASKAISGPGVPGLTWTYSFGPANGSFSPCNNCVTSKTVDVTDPEGFITRYTYGNRYFESEGKLEQIDAGWTGSAALRTTRITYRAAGAGPYPAQEGTTDETLGDGGTDLKNRPEETRTITQQGAIFTWQGSSFDRWARPLTITRSSTLGYTRSETTSYEDNFSNWVLNQVKTVTEGYSGKVMLSNLYNQTTATLDSVQEFGKNRRSMTYFADGTLNTVADGKNQVTTYSNYRRGIPQRIAYANGTSESATVDNIGKIGSLTNEAGTTTTLTYDAMGRLASVSYPTGDSVVWTPTTISFAPSATGKFDLAAGHWRQQVQVGNAYTVMYYDALWRPVYTERWDNADIPGTMRITKQSYDSAGRGIYESYPKRTYSDLGEGRTSTYDALGRPVSIIMASELGALHSSYSYEAGFETAFIDARQKRTVYRYQDFDQPTGKTITNIALPENVNVAIARDIFGKPTAITRSGGGKSLTRRYAYDAFELLCQTIEPETGATIQDYDAANNITWRVSGLTASSPTVCDTAAASAAAARKISFGYDKRNRLERTTFGDGSAAITQTYTADSLPETITSNGTKWTYSYNKRRLNERESLNYGAGTYNIDRAYDANGSLAQLKYPVDNLTVTYNPNALGQARQVGSYASQITYHPNGAVARFVYGNGIVRTLAQNTRGLPAQSTDAGILNESYDYDQNANVAKITDVLQGTATRTMGYDGLDRLKTVAAPTLWGTVLYGYDALDNLISTSMGPGANARNTVHTINPSTNRLDAIVNGPAAFNFNYGYDLQGNIIKRGTQTYRFDIANRMSQADNRATYVYDGLGRRTSIVGTDGVNRLQVYSQGGQLLYVAPTGGTGTKYIYLNNHQIAEVK